jgi:hypothetical protein
MNQLAIDAFISANSVQFMEQGVLSAVQAQVQKIKPDLNAELLLEEVVPLFSAKRENIEPEFNRLVQQWKSTRSSTSSSTAIAMHPAYQRIIGLGKPALSLILRELGKQLDHWFWALKAISGEDPVPSAHIGKMKLMAADWIQWGKQQGYVR